MSAKAQEVGPTTWTTEKDVTTPYGMAICFRLLPGYKLRDEGPHAQFGVFGAAD